MNEKLALALIERGMETLDQTADGLGKWDDATEWVEFASEQLRYAYLALIGEEARIPDRQIDRAQRFLRDD